MCPIAATSDYRNAELGLRALLFGDGVDSAGRLKGEEARRQAAAYLRRMRAAFDEALDESRRNAERANLAEDLVEAVRDTLDRRRPALE